MTAETLAAEKERLKSKGPLGEKALAACESAEKYGAEMVLNRVLRVLEEMLISFPGDRDVIKYITMSIRDMK